MVDSFVTDAVPREYESGESVVVLEAFREILRSVVTNVTIGQTEGLKSCMEMGRKRRKHNLGMFAKVYFDNKKTSSDHRKSTNI